MASLRALVAEDSVCKDVKRCEDKLNCRCLNIALITQSELNTARAEAAKAFGTNLVSVV